MPCILLRIWPATTLLALLALQGLLAALQGCLSSDQETLVFHGIKSVILHVARHLCRQ